MNTKSNFTPTTKQFKGEAAPRSLYRAYRSGGSGYRAYRSGGSGHLELYAFTVRQAFEQAGFNVKHKVTFENGEMIHSECDGQKFIMVKA
jgi:hypothetical protein